MCEPTAQTEDGMAQTPANWERRAARCLKAELKRVETTYGSLAAKLNGKGFNETNAGITSKLARGAFTATFFLAALA